MTVKVFDSVLENSFLNFIREEINILAWTKVQSVDPVVLKEGKKNPVFFASTRENPLSHQFLFNYFCDKYNLSNKFLRAYVNCHPPYSGGQFHADDGDMTFIFYPDEKVKNKGGTEFEDGTKVDYKSNRLIIFDAKLFHKASENLSNEMRHSIAWKTLIIKEDRNENK